MAAGKITVDLSERELRCLLDAMGICRDQTVNDGWYWWVHTGYADALYGRLVGISRAHHAS